jgi:hypothetical protein
VWIALVRVVGSPQSPTTFCQTKEPCSEEYIPAASIQQIDFGRQKSQFMEHASSSPMSRRIRVGRIQNRSFEELIVHVCRAALDTAMSTATMMCYGAFPSPLCRTPAKQAMSKVYAKRCTMKNRLGTAPVSDMRARPLRHISCAHVASTCLSKIVRSAAREQHNQPFGSVPRPCHQPNSDALNLRCCAATATPPTSSHVVFLNSSEDWAEAALERV